MQDRNRPSKKKKYISGHGWCSWPPKENLQPGDRIYTDHFANAQDDDVNFLVKKETLAIVGVVTNNFSAMVGVLHLATEFIQITSQFGAIAQDDDVNFSMLLIAAIVSVVTTIKNFP